MHVELWVWIVTIIAVIGFFVFDFYSHVKNPHEPSLKESGFWSLFYIALSLAFAVLIGFVWNWEFAGLFVTGYATEKALSVDNLFVFLIIMTSFMVPKIAQQKALLIGIAIALVLRAVFIFLGVAILEAWSWVFYIFGAWLLYIGIRQGIDSFRDDEPEMPGWVKYIRKFIKTSDHYNSDKWTIVEGGKKVMTPLVLVVVALGFTDVLFALDSIPAILGITQETYLVFMANALALMGLRQLYFLIGGLLERLVFLDLGLAFILGFIGVKTVFHAMHANDLPFINDGEPFAWAPDIPVWFSLIYIFGVLLIAIIASLIYTDVQKKRGNDDGAEAVEGAVAVGSAGAPEVGVAGASDPSEASAELPDSGEATARKTANDS